MQVACLQVPDFLVAIARRDDPSLAGRAVIVGGAPEEHVQVTACSEEAAKAGVLVGMSLRRALALCPKAVFLPLKESQVQAESRRLVELLKRYSPAVEVIAPGHAHVDVRGLAAMARMSEEDWLADLHEAAGMESGLPVHTGAAATVFAAHAAALTPGWTLVPGQLTQEFLWRLPVEVLPVPPHMHQALRLFGLERLGQLAKLPFSAMQAQFGREGARAWQLAHGEDDSAVIPMTEELSLSETLDLPVPTALSEPLVVGTRALLERALRRKELQERSIRRLEWRLDLESGEAVTRRFVFREPTADAARMAFVARQKIEKLQLDSPGVALAITLSGLCSEYGHQGNLWQIGPRRWRELVEAIEQLHTRCGGPRVFRIVDVQPWSRIPERQLGFVAFTAWEERVG